MSDNGRIVVRGKPVSRGRAKRADYIPYYKPNIPIALIEAKDDRHGIGGAMRQALGRAETLNIPHVFSSNGDGFVLVVIELKRDLTPRDVVARGLDYASWADAPDASDIGAIFADCAKKRGEAETDLGAAFEARFGVEFDEDELDASHRVVVVAASGSACPRRTTSAWVSSKAHAFPCAIASSTAVRHRRS